MQYRSFCDGLQYLWYLLTQCQYWNLISKHYLDPYVTLKYQTHFPTKLALYILQNFSIFYQQKNLHKTLNFQMFLFKRRVLIFIGILNYYVLLLCNKCNFIGHLTWDSWQGLIFYTRFGELHQPITLWKDCSCSISFLLMDVKEKRRISAGTSDWPSSRIQDRPSYREP